MKTKKIVLSFDYELFFGVKSGTILKTLIEPTNLLLDCMDSVGVKGNFFIDYLMFAKMEELDDEKAKYDLTLIKEQVKDMVRRGHRIEFHLHPHWIDAKYNGDGTWDFDNFTHYSLSSLDEDTIVSLFTKGTSYLTGIAHEVDPGYEIVAFRAGGWAVQPFDKLKRGFFEAGIKIDSSTSFGIYRYQQESFYDYRKMPDKVMYHYENDVCKEVADGAFVEVPITSYHRWTFPYRILDKLFILFSSKLDCITDGTHYRNDQNKKNRKSNLSMMTMSKLSTISVVISFVLRRSPVITYIDHPKDFSYSTLSSIKWISKHAISLTYKELLSQKDSIN